MLFPLHFSITVSGNYSFVQVCQCILNELLMFVKVCSDDILAETYDKIRGKHG